MTRAMGGDVEPVLRLEDGDQVAAIRAAIFRSARVAGVGPVRADLVAEHAAAHLVGQLAARGLVLRVEWTSPAARDAVVRSRRAWDVEG
ncbi:hypothetical protein [Nocardioides sambongensis]|uniref:hypothetical protein n=1 Tax=Nocardioides sambongensis TaxID=2589074 RepID=UPI00112DF319|nr:hypothetical protein [Nocardioides sambongensis]